jgi:2-(1,2-epoxy-1,2-dihydrophenyl)acetyl-CoA isomerase
MPRMSFASVRIDIADHVGTLTMARPRQLNALDLTSARELAQATQELGRDPSVRAVVISGEGKAFSAGGDVAEFHANVDRGSEFLAELVGQFHIGIMNLLEMPKPVIAAVNGVVAGGAIGLFLAADLAVAAESATFVMAYTGIGVCPDGGSTFFVPRLIGSRRALELMLTNRRLGAQEALDWGLVNQVVPDAELATTVRTLAQRLASGPTLAYAEARALVRQSFSNTAKAQLEQEARGIAAMGATADFREGVTAFVEKRKPKFTGK